MQQSKAMHKAKPKRNSHNHFSLSESTVADLAKHPLKNSQPHTIPEPGIPTTRLISWKQRIRSAVRSLTGADSANFNFNFNFHLESLN
jgi:hypothetical protein